MASLFKRFGSKKKIDLETPPAASPGSPSSLPSTQKTSDGSPPKKEPSKVKPFKEEDQVSVTVSMLSEDVVSWESTVPPKVLDRLLARERQRQQVFFEMIQTEQAYVRDLVIVRSLFRQSLEDSHAVGPEEIDALFSNLDEIIVVNGELYERMVSRRKDGVVDRIADIFVDMFGNNKFEPYVKFCMNQKPASDLYVKLMANNPEFAKVMKKCGANIRETKGFDLPSFLLKGMQRLLKYHPLFVQILKRTKETDRKEISEVTAAMNLVEKFSNEINEKVRAAENKFRLPMIEEQIVREPTLIPWLGRRDFNLSLTADPSRALLLEGPLRLITSQSFEAEDLQTSEYAAFLLSDMLLLTTEKDGKFLLREGAKPYPIIHLYTITDIRAEITPPGRERTTLFVEIGAKKHQTQKEGGTILGIDSPRPLVQVTVKKVLRFLFPSVIQLKQWMVHLLKAREETLAKLEAQLKATPQRSYLDLDEYAVILLVSSLTSAESSTDDDIRTMITKGANMSARPVDWEISFTQHDNHELQHMETTRSVRIVQGGTGLGLTLMGRNPVIVQEVDPEGPAAQAGILIGDAIRAVNGVDCTNEPHEKVVGMIKDALREPEPRTWVPLTTPLQPITDGDNMSILSEERGGTRTHRTMYLDKNGR